MPSGRRADPRLRLVEQGKGNGRDTSGDAPVVPLVAPPPCPAWLTGYAREEWDRTAPELVRVGLMTDLDLNTFAAYCSAFANFRRAEELLAADAAKDPEGGGLLKTAASGASYMSPVLTTKIASAKEMAKLAQLLGLTPSGRASIDRAGKGGAGGAGGRNGVEKKYGF